jgi:hypothetical protein
MSQKTWTLLPKAGVLVMACGLAVAAAPAGLAQEASDKPKPKKVWTDDDLKGPASANPAGTTSGTLAANGADPGLDSGVAGNSTRLRYTRDKDPKWYARELQPLREELAKVDTEIRSLQEARKDGKGVTDAVSLEEEPEGVSPDAQMELLKSEHAELVRKIDELEEQGRHNGIAPGDLRDDRSAQSGAGAMPSGSSGDTEGLQAGESSDVVKELEREIADGKEQLENSTKEAELLQRDLKLELQQESSSPEARSRRDKRAAFAQTSSLLNDKRVEAGELEKKIAELEDKVKEEELNVGVSPKAGSGKNSTGASPIDDALASAADAEAQWRKQFATIDYKIRMAKTELDILQRELNLDLTQYTGNPSTTMKESITRKQINEHRKAIDDKEKQLVDLNAIRAQLEEELRHAGEPAGWSRP